MSKAVIGLDFGMNEVKLAVMDQKSLLKTCSFKTPERLVKNGWITSQQVMGEFLKDSLKKVKTGTRSCAVVLPSAIALTRCIEMPVMTTEQLEMNLPFEFRDYIDQGKEKYQFDYAVLDMPENKDAEDAQMQLMACAALKSDLKNMMQMLRAAGLKAVTLIPVEFAYRNLIRHSLSRTQEPVCIIDFGHEATRIYIYRGERYEITRVLEHGGLEMDEALSEHLAFGPMESSRHKSSLPEEMLSSPEMLEIYRTIALEVMRAINFYNYDTQSNLRKAYVTGGCATNPVLLSEVKEVSGIRLVPIDELLPPGCESSADKLLYAAAVGAAWQ